LLALAHRCTAFSVLGRKLTAALSFLETTLRLSGIEMGSRNEDRSREKPRDHRDGTKADSPLHHFLFQTFSSWGRENVVLAIAQRGLCVALEALAAESVTKIAARRI
jgi:hypothetical protein